jgi:hypothetical protein
MRHMPSHRESFTSHRPIEDRRHRLDGQRTKTATLGPDVAGAVAALVIGGWLVELGIAFLSVREPGLIHLLRLRLKRVFRYFLCQPL